MFLTTSTETRQTLRAPNFSVNWTIGQDQGEIVKTVNGKTEQGVSRICKQIFARKFVEVCRSGLEPINNFKLKLLECYSDAKDVQSIYKVCITAIRLVIRLTYTVLTLKSNKFS